MLTCCHGDTDCPLCSGILKVKKDMAAGMLLEMLGTCDSLSTQAPACYVNDTDARVSLPKYFASSLRHKCSLRERL